MPGSDTGVVDIDLSGALGSTTGIERAQIAAFGPLLDAVRRRWLNEADDSDDGELLAEPERTLEHYHEKPAASLLGRTLRKVHWLREQVDRVAVIAPRSACLPPQVLFEACCEPHFNELSRGDRGSRPRVYFCQNHFDNDVVRGLLKLFRAGRVARRIEDRWAVVAVEPCREEAGLTLALSPFLNALRKACNDDVARAAGLVIPIVRGDGDWGEFIGVGGAEPFRLSRGGYRSAFSVACLLPASVLGTNVVRLLEGAVAMNEHFRTAAPGANRVLDFAGVCHLLRARGCAGRRVLRIWTRSIEGIGEWYDQLLAGDQNHAAVLVRGGAIRPEQPAEEAGSLVVSLSARQCRTDPIAIGAGGEANTASSVSSPRYLPDILSERVSVAKRIWAERRLPVVEVRLPETREFWIGQLMQMLTLATVMERRLAAQCAAEARE